MKGRFNGFGLLCAAFVAALALAGCKQGEGDVCQVNADCKSGLICNAGTMQCQPAAGPDAAPAPDAGPTPDAPVAVDAAIDAAPDAAIDAGDEEDAGNGGNG
jgi:hypothetical protein